MSTLNNSDIMVSNRTRDMKNKFKKNKGVKHTKAIKFEVQEHWKRAFNIRYQKQSRKDNFVGVTFPDEDNIVPATVPEIVPVPVQHLVPSVSFTTLDWVHERGGWTKSPVVEVTQFDADEHDSDEEFILLGDITDDNIARAIKQIEFGLRSLGLTFKFWPSLAMWDCAHEDFVFSVRLWWSTEDKLMVGTSSSFDVDSYRYDDISQEFFSKIEFVYQV